MDLVLTLVRTAFFASKWAPVLLCLFAAFSIPPAIGAAATEHANQDHCNTLMQSNFSSTPDAITQLTGGGLSPTTGPQYCEIKGYIAPSIHFVIRLPAEIWNGKFIELGCGGTCGSTEHISGCAGPLKRGYACIVADGGNGSSGGDMKWAYNNPQAVVDYVVRSSHVTALVGKAIAARFYGEAPKKSYFMGCSAGGLQALSEAQHFPWDFDGIVAGDPSASVSHDWMDWLWANRSLHDTEGKRVFERPALELLHKAVLAKCDDNDGLKDGLIGDPQRCSFSPEELSCKRRGAAQDCLSDLQVEAARRMYAGPTTSSGKRIGVPFAFKGSELGWIEAASGDVYLSEWFRYYLFQPNPGPSWKLADFNFDRDYQRFGVAELTEPLNPDVRRLRDAGAKMILYSGWNDTAASTGTTVDYYENVEKIMGGHAATQTFLRLFVVPGMNHCTGDDGPFAIDYLSYLEAWVEGGRPPDKMIGAHISFGDLPQKATAGDEAAEQQIEQMQQFPLDSKLIQFSRPFTRIQLRRGT